MYRAVVQVGSEVQLPNDDAVQAMNRWAQEHASTIPPNRFRLLLF